VPLKCLLIIIYYYYLQYPQRYGTSDNTRYDNMSVSFYYVQFEYTGLSPFYTPDILFCLVVYRDVSMKYFK